jgi:NADH-quinone oxidoreductase subunit G
MFINQEGRLQMSPPAFPGGTPAAQIGGGDHPPRIYDAGLPGSEPAPAGLTLASVGDETFPLDEKNAAENIWKMVTDSIPELVNYESADHLPQRGIRLGGPENTDLRFVYNWSLEKDVIDSPDDEFELVLVDWTFGTEELSSLSACLQELERDPCLIMHVDDAQKLGISEGDFVEITSDVNRLQVMVCLVDNMARGTLLLPRHPRLVWQIFRNTKITIKRDQIKKRV